MRRNGLLKHVILGKIKGRLVPTGGRGRRRKETMDDHKEKAGKRKHYNVLCGELSLEETMDLSYDRMRNELMNDVKTLNVI